MAIRAVMVQEKFEPVWWGWKTNGQKAAKRLVSNKIPVKVKMKVRDFKVIIYKYLENLSALCYNNHN